MKANALAKALKRRENWEKNRSRKKETTGRQSKLSDLVMCLVIMTGGLSRVSIADMILAERQISVRQDVGNVGGKYSVTIVTGR